MMADRISSVIMLSLVMLFAQNLLFTGTYGLSRLLPILERPRECVRFCAIVTVFSTLAALCGGTISGLFPDTVKGNALFGLACAVILGLLYTLFALLAKLFHKVRWIPALSLGVLNSAVLIVPLAARHLLLEPLEAMILGLFSGLGFTVGAILLQFGFAAISVSHIPRTFRGLPVKLLYVAILSMVFLGFSGQLFRV